MPQLSQIVRALRHKNYRLFFTGQFISLTGTWITSVATSWLAYRLTHSEMMLGIVGFAGQFPSFLLAPIAGVLVDRWNRKYVLLGTQAASMIQSSVLAYLALSETVTITSLCILSVIQALINAFDMPARQTFVYEMIEDKADLPNAIALNSAMFNGARLIGPAIGGIIIAAFNEGACFLVDAVSYCAVLASLFRIHVAAEHSHYSAQNILDGLREGFSYVVGSTPIREILITVALISLVGTPHIVLMPVFAHDILEGGPSLLGILMGSSGFGAVVGALYLASRMSVRGLGGIIAGTGFLLGASLLCFAFSRAIWLSMVVIFVSGAAMITLLASANTILQTLSDKSKRGRVMSFYMMSFMGMMPLGSLAAGLLASATSAPLTVFIGGVATLIVSFRFTRKLPQIRAEARPIYRKLGIIPSVDVVNP